MTTDVRLETANLVLRELRDDDAGAVHLYASDTAVVRYLDWGPSTVEDTEQYLVVVQATREAVPRAVYHLAIVLKATNGLIGGCRIEVRSPVHESGDIGYVLHRDAWGHGYATEATRALLTFGFERLALHRIWATCDVENRASARVLEKVGMRREGHLRQSVRRRAEWRDAYLYAILEPEWRKAQPGV
jgi:[ribosomal protein S5]-alanine N-acetyltransferase